ncbi:DUF1850 domain-containing protein [Comamonas flocculans]|uniref:DUF1850 domain-containing protein n=1 Tax=Comamonas flocculans TaxID=2597701 RepID=A0A5B8RW90_9BURK|nr:DUF1850 domain-containing protein [Comamonas flocculans]QEA13760.1 DUF1850 domain-containing protein [Comamonas flocculans]
MGLGICLVLAAAAHATPAFVPVTHFTLAWTHSIEKQRWEEDYVVHAGKPPRLEAGAARIRGSAAGMEPPPEAQLVDGWFVYQPARWPRAPLLLTRSEFTADFDLCAGGACRPMGELLPSDGGITLLSPCTHPE